MKVPCHYVGKGPKALNLTQPLALINAMQVLPTPNSTNELPSLLELLSLDSLSAQLYPISRYAIHTVADRFPRYFLRVAEAHDELFAGTLMALQLSHLRSRGGKTDGSDNSIH